MQRIICTLALLALAISCIPAPGAGGQEQYENYDCRSERLWHNPRVTGIQIESDDWIKAQPPAAVVYQTPHDSLWHMLTPGELQPIASLVGDGTALPESFEMQFTTADRFGPFGFVTICKRRSTTPTATLEYPSTNGCIPQVLEPGQNRLALDIPQYDDHATIMSPHGDIVVHMNDGTRISINEGQEADVQLSDVDSIQNMSALDALTIYVCFYQHTPTPQIEQNCLSLSGVINAPGNAHVVQDWSGAADAVVINGNYPHIVYVRDTYEHVVVRHVSGAAFGVVFDSDLRITLSNGDSAQFDRGCGGLQWMCWDPYESGGSADGWKLINGIYGVGTTPGAPFEAEVCFIDDDGSSIPSPTDTPPELAATRTALVATVTAAPPPSPFPSPTVTTTPCPTAGPAPGCFDVVFNAPWTQSFMFPNGGQYWQSGGWQPLYVYPGAAPVPRAPRDVSPSAQTYTFGYRNSLSDPVPDPPSVLTICGDGVQDVTDPADQAATATAFAGEPTAHATPDVPDDADLHQTQVSLLATIAADQDRDIDITVQVPPLTVEFPDDLSDIATVQSGQATVQAGQATAQSDFATAQAEALQPGQFDDIPGWGHGTPTLMTGEIAIGTMTSAFDGKEPFASLDQITGIYSDTADIFIDADTADCRALGFLDTSVEFFGNNIALNMNEPFCVFIDRTVTIRNMLRLASVIALVFVMYRYITKRHQQLSQT